MKFYDNEIIDIKLKHFYESEGALVSYNSDKSIAICETTSTYIPIGEFKILFTKISELIKKEKIRKFIFDKRSLRTFHQPSMEWYYLTWKEEMYNEGLSVYRKILPNDPIFRESVRIGHANINKEYPENISKKLDIRYVETLDEAVHY
jgi:hypothetical protein